jgi:2,4-dienoyl-CoA reductase-like NADH-dependent reductase (Old Yellow Enzyme family)
MTVEKLFQALDLGSIQISNRIVMAPMTRSRATANGLATPSIATYYEQRSTAGLLISEGVYPSAIGKGYLGTPGLYNEEQKNAWKTVTDRVHAKGGKIVVQLMHAGRISHSSLLPDEALPVAPSAVAANGMAWTKLGQKPHPVPHALSKSEIVSTIEAYAHSAKLAIEAGFDGVELHNASGYLPMQFLSTNANQRTDEYGGSSINRTRFSLEVLEALGHAIGIERVGVKISPEMGFNDIQEADPVDTYKTLVSRLPKNMSYLHVMRAGWKQANYFELLKPLFKGAFLAGGGVSRDEAIQMVSEKTSDAVVFGMSFISNPDLPMRLRLNAELAQADQSKLYMGGDKGFIDYPALSL